MKLLTNFIQKIARGSFIGEELLVQNPHHNYHFSKRYYQYTATVITETADLLKA